MKQFGTYLCLQFKRCAKVMARAVLILTVLGLAVFLILFGVDRIFKAFNLSLVKVGIVIPEEETVSRYVTDFIASMDSVKSICSFEYLEEEEAMEKYNNEVLEAVIVLPRGFYHDVQVGLNPPAVIYVKDENSKAGAYFKEMLLSGVSFLQSAESGVYATLDTAYTYGSSKDTKDIGNDMAVRFLNMVMNRDRMFETKEVSAFDNIAVSEYFFLAGCVLFLMYFGVIFAGMYRKNEKAVEDKLRINGMNALAFPIAKILVMTVYIYIVGMLLLTGGMAVFGVMDIRPVMDFSGAFGAMAVLAVTLSIYFGIIFDITGNPKQGVLVLLLINTVGALCSGLVIPTVYLSNAVSAVGELLPMRLWMRLLVYALFR